MVDVQTISVVIAAASVVFGVIAWVQQNRENKEINQARLFMQIYDRFYNLEHVRHQLAIWNWEWKDFDDFQEKYAFDSNFEVASELFIVCSYFEGIGVLVKRKLIDPTVIDDLISGTVLRTWEQFEPIIKDTRKRLNWPQYFEWFEYLYNEIKAIAWQQHPELRK